MLLHIYVEFEIFIAFFLISLLIKFVKGDRYIHFQENLYYAYFNYMPEKLDIFLDETNLI